MSSLSLLSLSGAAIIVLLAVCDGQYYDFTLAPEYDDYNATFEYSLFSNGSNEDLDLLSKRFVDPAEDATEDAKDTTEDATEDATEDTTEDTTDESVTMTTAPVTTERPKSRVTVTTARGTTEREMHNAASLPVSLEIRTLVWTLLILISLNTL